MHVQTKKKGKQYTFSVMVKPALINSSRYEYASSGLVNISYRNINHSFIGNLSVAGDRNRQAGARGWRKEGERKHTVLWESSKDKGVCSFCVCVRTCLIEIQIGWLVYHSKCVLRLFYTRFGDTAFICRKKTCTVFHPPQRSVSHLPHLLPPDEDSAPTALLPYVSAETKVPLRAFSHSIFL